MNLLAPFKACMQCLPVFSSDSPPSSPRPSSAEKPHTDKNAHALASPSPPHAEKPSFSDSSLIHDNEPKTDLPVSEPAKIELGLPHTHSPSPHSTQPVVHVYDDLTLTADARHGAKGDEDDSHHKAAQPASVKEETSHKTGSSPHPSLHAGVDFSSSGLMPLPSPLSPTPIGLGYVVGPHSTSHHIHHQVNSHSHEGHDKTHPLSTSSHSTEGKGAAKQPSSGKEHAPSPTLSSPHPGKEHESPPPVASSGKPLEIPPVSASSESGKGSQDKEHSHHQHFHLRIPHHQDDVQDSESGKEHSHHQHFHIGLHHHPGDVQDHAPHPSPVPSKSSAPQHAEAPHTHDKKHLETSHSAPQVNRVPSHGAAATGASSVLETSHSEPIEAKAGTGHGHFFKDLQDKLKQGGHHLKEEGSKHLHNIVSFTEDGSKHLHNILNFTEEGSKHRTT